MMAMIQITSGTLERVCASWRNGENTPGKVQRVRCGCLGYVTGGCVAGILMIYRRYGLRSLSSYGFRV